MTLTLAAPRHVAGAALLAATFAATAWSQGSAATGLRAARTLARGDTITSADVVPDSGITTDPRTVIGFVARRVIREGELLRPPAIGTPVVVRTGSIVTVWAVAGGVTIQRDGVALHDAGKGEPVRIRINTRSTLSAIVRDSANVVLP
jgi:flagella basal body P-ring formation protein FlgA